MTVARPAKKKDERRKHRRLQCEGRLLLIRSDDDQRVADLRDLCFTGVGVVSSEPLPVGAEYQLAMQTPSGTRIDCTAKVVHADVVTNVCGLTFTDIEWESLVELQRFLRELYKAEQPERPPAKRQALDVLDSPPPRRATRKIAAASAGSTETGELNSVDEASMFASVLPASLEKKIRDRLAKATVIDPTLEYDEEAEGWIVRDRATKMVLCRGIVHSGDAALLARSREYIAALLNELDRVRLLGR